MAAFCTKCGSPLASSAGFCPACGTAIAPGAGAAAAPVQAKTVPQRQLSNRDGFAVRQNEDGPAELDFALRRAGMGGERNAY